MLGVPMMLRNTDIEGDTVSRQEEQRPKAEDIHSVWVSCANHAAQGGEASLL